MKPPVKRTIREMRGAGEYCWEQYSAQLPVIGLPGQARLRRTRVHVAGLGGLGMAMGVNLACLGVGTITTNDPQELTIDNLNRIQIASLHDLSLSKVQLLARFLQFRPGLHFQGLKLPSESKEVAMLFKQSNCIVCCSNTIESRMAAARAAVRLKKLLIDVAVGDARRQFAGFVKIYDPTVRELACPACYFSSHQQVERSEGLLPTVISATVSMATHAIFVRITRPEPKYTSWNLSIIDLAKPAIEVLRIFRNRECQVCSKHVSC